MLTVRELTKRYGETTVVDALTFEAVPGKVTGFLGPNGAGKSTTMRMVLGLDHPTSGAALVNRRRYAQIPLPAREIGALLEAKAVHPGRSAHDHLLAMARSSGIPKRRVADVLDMVGLSDVAGRRVATFSLGMGQRLGIAGALLGDPGTLMFDEPVNGLDLDGVRWVRDLMRSLADEGRTVFVSSHLMSEMELIADQLVVIGEGRLIADAPVSAMLAGSAHTVTAVRTPEPDILSARLAAQAEPDRPVTVESTDGGELLVFGLAPEEIGDHAYAAGARIHTLYRKEASLEQAYLELTDAALTYGAQPRGTGEKEHQSS